MDFNYDHNYDINQDYLNNPEKYCEICTLELDDKCVSLDCKHKFHYECLMFSMQISDSKYYNMQCPYCRVRVPFIPLLDGQKPIRNLHKEYNEYIKKEITVFV